MAEELGLEAEPINFESVYYADGTRKKELQAQWDAYNDEFFGKIEGMLDKDTLKQLREGTSK